MRHCSDITTRTVCQLFGFSSLFSPKHKPTVGQIFPAFLCQPPHVLPDFGHLPHDFSEFRSPSNAPSCNWRFPACITMSALMSRLLQQPYVRGPLIPPCIVNLYARFTLVGGVRWGLWQGEGRGQWAGGWSLGLKAPRYILYMTSAG